MSRVLIFMLGLLLGGSLSVWAEERLEVVVSIEPQRWLVEQIGGDQVDVAVLVAPGESPTTYLPADAQMTRLMKAQIFFRIGVPFERGLWFDAIRSMGRLNLIDLREGIELVGDDPHIWLVPDLLVIQATTVAEALSQQDPNHRTLFEENLAQFEIRMEMLDERLRDRLSPFEGQTIFVFHPSWSYFADAYGIRQVAIETGGREPSDRELTRLQEEARELGIATVFVQPQIHDRSARAFAESIDADLDTLDPLAADVASNLEVTVDKLVRSFGGSQSL